MKAIDIMQKVANKEIFKFKIGDFNYYVDKSNYICEENGTRVEWYIDDEWLNMNAEIIEEDKKIKKVSECFTSTDNKEIQFLIDNINQLGNKINEIIDKINSMED